MYKISLEEPTSKGHRRDQGVDQRIMLKFLSTLQGARGRAGLIKLLILNNVGFANTASISLKNGLLSFTNIMGRSGLICTKLEMVLTAKVRDYRRNRCDQKAVF